MRLGATPTLCTSLVAEVLAEFHGWYPGIDIEIFERGSRSLIGALAEFEETGHERFVRLRDQAG